MDLWEILQLSPNNNLKEFSFHWGKLLLVVLELKIFCSHILTEYIPQPMQVSEKSVEQKCGGTKAI